MRILEGNAARQAADRFAAAARTKRHEQVDAVVRRIVRDVRRQGDAALRRYAQRLDGLGSKQPLRVPKAELQRAWREIPGELRNALRFAAKNIRRFAEWQTPKEWTRAIAPGCSVGQIVRPLDSVGCYVPGGRYPLPSTVLMTAIPAQVAGVSRIAIVSPKPGRETMAAAAMLGLDEFYRIGGAQAIAALAYGTKTLPRVDKIVGPGNSYVTTAKKMVSPDCAIDMLAGPTETLIYSESGNVAFIAADLVAQAEHDVETRLFFVTTKRRLAQGVSDEIKKQVATNSTAQRALKRNGFLFVARTRSEAFGLINCIAPEHLTVDHERDIEHVQNAGSIFIGKYSAQPIGDYCSGPNHVLPTGGFARCRGGLSVTDFVKVISVQQLSGRGLPSVANTTTTMARAEGLEGHARAVEVRLGIR